MRLIVPAVTIAVWLAAAGCRSSLIDRTDRDVYHLIADGQRHALGTTSDVRIGNESGETGPTSRMYQFQPRPVDAGIPQAFQVRSTDTAPASGPVDAPPSDSALPSDDAPTPDEATSDHQARPGDETEGATSAEISPSVFSEAQCGHVVTFGLRDTLAYAAKHGRDLQNAKEDLYLAALDLSLERHLWTPQFTAAVQAAYQDFEETGDFDRAMSAVSEAAVTQRLPFGGQLSARIIHSIMREIGEHVGKGETGHMILSADIPLLRGAGPAAYESRYTAERELIYAVRRFERFRRSFLVEVAAEYFSLQQAKAAIGNTYASYQSRRQAWAKAEAFQRLGKSRSVFEAPRAKSNLRQAETALVSAKERYESALDRFKILIGMPVDALLDVVDQERDAESQALDTLLPDIDEATAVEVALKYRLDLLNSADGVDDARRGIAVARNRILPDLDLTGGVTLDSDSTQLRPVNFRQERTTWDGGVRFRLDDRKTERNAYRASLVGLRRAERNHEIAGDTVRADVRRAIRRIMETADLRTIQAMNVEENEQRLNAAKAQFDLGRSTNQDMVDAEDDLLAARNAYAGAVANYRVAILELRRDTGTLRVADDGRWLTEPAPDDARRSADGP